MCLETPAAVTPYAGVVGHCSRRTEPRPPPSRGRETPDHPCGRRLQYLRRPADVPTSDRDGWDVHAPPVLQAPAKGMIRVSFAHAFERWYKLADAEHKRLQVEKKTATIALSWEAVDPLCGLAVESGLKALRIKAKLVTPDPKEDCPANDEGRRPHIEQLYVAAPGRCGLPRRARVLAGPRCPSTLSERFLRSALEELLAHCRRLLQDAPPGAPDARAEAHPLRWSRVAIA
jgi:hypothetical protein